MNRLLVGVLAVVLVSYAGTAQPQKRSGGTFPMERADANSDGNVSWAEVREVAPRFTQERFNDLDKNGDGLLSKADAPKRSGGAKGKLPEGDRLIAILRRADEDGNDRVTKKELMATAPQLAKRGFARLDTNKDGAISEADFNKPKKNARGGGPTPQAIKRADANGDGQWSYAEIKTVAKQLPERAFNRADDDGDGVLNAKELQALRRSGNQQSKRADNNTEQAKVRRDAIDKILKSDSNSDGSVSFEELTAAKPGFPRNTFNRSDRNNDGVVSSSDIS